MAIHLGKQISKYVKIDKLLKRSNSPHIEGVALVEVELTAKVQGLAPRVVSIALTGTPIVYTRIKTAKALRFQINIH